jgi:hypothetical protein
MRGILCADQTLNGDDKASISTLDIEHFSLGGHSSASNVPNFHGGGRRRLDISANVLLFVIVLSALAAFFIAGRIERRKATQAPA